MRGKSDDVDVDLACGGVGVPRSRCNRGQRDTGVDHQLGVVTAKAVNGDIRRIVGADEVTEPAVYTAFAHRKTLLSLPAAALT